MRHALLPVLLAASLWSANCGREAVTNPAPPTSRRPNAGTTYTFLHRERGPDSVVVPGSERTITSTVTDATITIGGENEVVSIEEKNGHGYLSYEASGDVMVNGQLLLPGNEAFAIKTDLNNFWLRYPIGSRQTISLSEVDTIFNGWRYRFNGMIEYVGSQRLKTPAGEFETIKLTLTSSTTLDKSKSSTVREFWYAPSIGYIVKDIRTSNMATGAWMQDERELTSYSLK